MLRLSVHEAPIYRKARNRGRNIRILKIERRRKRLGKKITATRRARGETVIIGIRAPIIIANL